MHNNRPMKTQPDLLTLVRQELMKCDGQLRAIAAATGMSHDSVRNIKHMRHDPAYGKVAALGRYFGLVLPPPPEKRKKTRKPSSTRA
jgi:hypothetical protein